MKRPLWTLCAVAALAIGFSMAGRASVADKPRGADAVQDFAFLETGKEYAFILSSGNRDVRGKIVERLAGNWIRLEGTQFSQGVNWWVNLNEVALIAPASTAAAPIVGPTTSPGI